jgi:RHS repeat-associated protein
MFLTDSGSMANGYSAGDVGNQPLATLYQYDSMGNLLRVDQKGTVPSDSTQWRTRTFVYDSLSRLLTANNPESGTISYSYDADGNLLQKTSPAANQTGTATQTVSYCYDALHRVTGKGYGAQSCPLSSPVVSYAYDSGANAKGKLVSLTDQAGTASYAYDVLGRLTGETRTLTGANNAAVSKNLAYSYNLDGSLKSLTYPSGAVVTYTPDSAGRTLSAIDGGNGINYATGATYGPDGSLTGFVSGNSGTFAGITSVYTYNKRLQPVNMSATAPSQTLYSVGYDFHTGNGTPGSGTDNGNVFGIYNYRDRDRDQSFTYDSLNRLLSAQNAGTDCTQMTVNAQPKTKYWGNSYSYDAWGNLLQKSITKCGAENLQVTADAHNWIHASGTDYQYDAAGNMTYDATASLSYTFDQENRITGAGGYTYVYDGDGNRVRKSNGNLAANGTLYWAMTPGVVAETDLAGTTKSEYVFFGGERVARRDGANGAGGVFYYFSDHLKTASVITDSAGTIKSESDFYPWGGELQFTNNDSNHYKFTGKERDGESGLDYFGARYYSGGLGRWVSADWSATPVPVPYADLTDPQSLNLYGYVRGLATTKSDIDGHSWWDKFKNSMGEARCWCEGEVAEKAKKKNREESDARQLAMDIALHDPKNQQILGIFQLLAFSNWADALMGASDEAPAVEATSETEAGETAPVEVTISKSKSPAAAQHIEDAQASGKPSTVTLDRSGAQGASNAAARGRAATKGTSTSPGMDRDEYPPRCCAEGGNGASVRSIPSGDNRSAGAQLGNQIKNLPDGTKITIKTGQ